MTDPHKAVRDYLLTNGALVALTSTRIYAAKDTPPTGYTPATTGAAICLKVAGGSPDYSGALISPRIQFKCYAATEVAAQALFSALYGALHEQAGGEVRWAMCETLGQIIPEPDTGWLFALSYFRVWLSANA